MVSSTDGYCSIIQFQDDELGKIYEKPIECEKIKETKLETTPTKEKKSQPFIDIDTNAMDIDIKKPDSITKLANDTKKIIDTVKNNDIKKSENQKNLTNEEKLKTNEIFEETEDIKLIYEDNNTENNVKPPTGRQTPTKVELPLVKTPRRVKLITISSPKNKKE